MKLQTQIILPALRASNILSEQRAVDNVKQYQ